MYFTNDRGKIPANFIERSRKRNHEFHQLLPEEKLNFFQLVQMKKIDNSVKQVHKKSTRSQC